MLRTKSGLPKHCTWTTDRHGKRRVRFRRRGFLTYLTDGAPWSEPFMRQYAAALDGAKAQATSVGKSRTIAGTVNALVVEYIDPNSKTSPFKTGAAETRRTRRNILENFRRAYGHLPLFSIGADGRRTMLLTHEHMQRIVNEKTATPFGQRNFLNTLRALFKWAMAEGRIPDDPTLGVTRPKVKTTGYKTWSEQHIQRIEAKYPIGTKGRLAFALILYTGLRRSDVVKVGPQHIHDGWLIIDQGKTEGGEEAHLEIPVHPKLREIIDATPTVGLKTFFGDALRQALHRARLRQLVSRTVRPSGVFRHLGSWRTQGNGAAACGDRVQRKPDRRHHRPRVIVGGPALYQGGRQKAHGAGSNGKASGERIMNKSLSNLETRNCPTRTNPLKPNGPDRAMVGPAGLEPATRRL